jgi:hypothetical protein
MYFLCGMNWVFIAQKTAFFIVTAVNTSNLTLVIMMAKLSLTDDILDKGLLVLMHGKLARVPIGMEGSTERAKESKQDTERSGPRSGHKYSGKIQ